MNSRFFVQKTNKFSIFEKLEVKTFSEKLSLITNHSFDINFESELVIKVIEDDIEKCRKRRSLMLANEKLTLPYLANFRLICSESEFYYDTRKFQLREELVKLLHIELTALEYLHLLFKNDKGRRKDRHEKRALLKDFTNPTVNSSFRQLYDRFVRTVITNHVATILSTEDTIYYQAFPCIRVVRPGEFSIGAHADISYGFSQGNINFYVPLTRIFGTNSLVLESCPGLEDWHVIDADVGYIKRFYGVLCSHFTMTNNTNQTRVSLDLRIIPGSCWQQNHDHFTSVDGYYAMCRRPEVQTGQKPSTIWPRIGDLLPPDHRVGFPFTKE